MSEHNRGFTGAHFRVSLISFFGTCLFGMAVLVVPVLLVARALVLPASAEPAGPQLSPKGSPTATGDTGDTCSLVVSSPNPGTPGGRLIAVAAVSANDVWAVGYYGSPAQTLVEHWNGTAWSVVPSPSPDANGNYLQGVAAVSAQDVWAVGHMDADSTSSPDRKLVEHWDGSSWSVISSPNPYGNLVAVAAVSANDVWAVGGQLIEHWDGTAWSVVYSPRPGTLDYLTGVAAVSANDVWAVGYYGSPARTLVEHWNGTAWSIVPGPDPGTGDSYLYGVAAVSANDVWAVGSRGSVIQTLVEHWDGTAWSVVPSPNPDYSSYLYGIAAVSTNNVWAVGSYCDDNCFRSHAYQALLEHWDGAAWSVADSPAAGTNSGVAAVSAGDIWAVGSYRIPSNGPSRTLVEHWDGTAWGLVSSPNAGVDYNSLRAVAALSTNDMWAVGTRSSWTLVEHWDGTAWAVLPSANPGTEYNYLAGVAAVSASDVWAVGGRRNPRGLSDSSQTLVEHWNGTAWSEIPSPNPATCNNLSSVAAPSANDVWAVGERSSCYGSSEALIEHWDGTAWSVVPGPNPLPNNSSLSSITALSANDVWAVGSYWTGNPYARRTLAMHWDGTAWAIVPGANPGTEDNYLAAVAALSANDVWAVGSYSNQAGANRTLVEHWDGTAWSVVPSPNPGTYASSLTGVAPISANDVWAVGEYNSQTLVEHWNGTAWSVVPSPNPGTSYNRLHGVAAISANDVWAVGSYDKEGSTWTLVERFIPCSACTVQYTDVPPGSAFYDYVHCLACRSIVSGYADGTFRPNNPVTRGQLSKIVSNSANYLETFATNTFEDVTAGSTFFPYVERLYAHGGIAGYACGNPEPCVPPDNKPYFRPGANVTRGQTSKIAAIAKGLPAPSPGQQSFEDVARNSTFWQWIEPLAATGAIGGYPCGGEGEPCVPPNNKPYFRPGADVTRGQAAKIVANTFFPNCSTPAIAPSVRK